MAIGTATAILGSAVIGAGASYLSNKSAANKASDAARYAADQNAAVNREIYQQTRSDLAPYNQAGQLGLTALLQELGVTQAAQPAPAQPAARPAMATAGTGTPAGAQPGFGFGDMTAEQRAGWVGTGNVRQAPSAAGKPDGGFAGTSPLAPTATVAPAAPTPDFNAYVQSDPAIMAEFNRNMASGKGREYLSSLGISTPEDFGRWHYDTYGRNEGRTLPMTQPAAPTTPTGQGPATPQGPSPARPGTDLMTADRPEAGPAPVYTRADDLSAPDMASFFSNFEADPGYQFRLKEGLNAVNAASAARGKLRSGDAAMALQERGEGLANQGYGDWWNRQYQLARAAQDDYRFQQGRQDLLFENDRGFGEDRYRYTTARNDNIFDTDRAYQTNRYDQNISNLFGLVGVGQNAAAGTASAGNVFAQNQTNSNNQRATTTANAAIANAQNTSNLFGSAAQAVGTYYGLRGRGTF